jgi:hypothetical protein
MSKQGKREFVQVLRLMEVFRADRLVITRLWSSGMVPLHKTVGKAVHSFLPD